MIALIFKLVKPARSRGGDKYEADLRGTEFSPLKDRPFVIYFPQEISREKGSPAPEMRVTFTSTFHGEDLP